jgi:molybdenum cofactor synthesis domain-containing protein
MGNEPPSARPYRVHIITASDRCARGEAVDESGPAIRRIAEAAGYAVAGYTLLPDDRQGLEDELKRVCDQHAADLILTAGGTGFSPRDLMPEAAAAVIERPAPGIPEALRQYSMTITRRAMFSRAAAGIRGRTLIINLPGSPRAVQEQLSFIIDELRHGLDMLTGAPETPR